MLARTLASFGALEEVHLTQLTWNSSHNRLLRSHSPPPSLRFVRIIGCQEWWEVIGLFVDVSSRPGAPSARHSKPRNSLVSIQPQELPSAVTLSRILLGEVMHCTTHVTRTAGEYKLNNVVFGIKPLTGLVDAMVIRTEGHLKTFYHSVSPTELRIKFAKLTQPRNETSSSIIALQLSHAPNPLNPLLGQQYLDAFLELPYLQEVDLAFDYNFTHFPPGALSVDADSLEAALRPQRVAIRQRYHDLREHVTTALTSEKADTVQLTGGYVDFPYTIRLSLNPMNLSSCATVVGADASIFRYQPPPLPLRMQELRRYRHIQGVGGRTVRNANPVIFSTEGKVGISMSAALNGKVDAADDVCVRSGIPKLMLCINVREISYVYSAWPNQPCCRRRSPGTTGSTGCRSMHSR